MLAHNPAHSPVWNYVKLRRSKLLFVVVMFSVCMFLAPPPAHAAGALDGSATYASAGNVAAGTVTLTTSNSNDIIYVFVTVRDNGPTVSSVTAGGLTFARRGTVVNAGNVIGDAWFAIAGSALLSSAITVSLTGGSTRITITAFGVSGANTSCPFDPNVTSPSTATGNSGTASVTVSTSTANDFLLGLIAVWIPNGGTTPTFSPGTGFTTIQAVSSSAGGVSNVQGDSQYEVVSSSQTNLAVSGTINPADQWGMIGDAIQTGAGTAVCQPMTITTANSAPSATGTLTGCNVSPTTIPFDGAMHTFTASALCTITITVPTDGATTRHRFSGGTTWTVMTCASGNCGGSSTTVYYQLGETYQATPVNPPTWDSGLTPITISGTVLGTASSTICTITLPGGGGSASCANAYSDYNLPVIGPPLTLGGSANNTQWITADPRAWTDATGGTTHSVNYYKQLTNTYRSSPSAPPTLDGSITFTVMGTSIGIAGSSVCTISVPASPVSGPYSCSGYADYNTTLNMPIISANNPANVRWQVAGTSSFTDTTGGNTHTSNYYKQLTNTYSFNPSAPTTFDGSLTFTTTGTFAGTVGSTICSVTLPTTPSAGAYSCSGYSDYNTPVSLPVLSASNPSNVQWISINTRTFTDTSGGNTHTTNYNQQLQNTYSAYANTPTTFSATITFAITGTSAGISGQTICTIAVPASPTAGAYICSGYADRSTAVTLAATSGNNPDANTRWQSSGTHTWTDTTGGNTHTTNYYEQLQNSYQITPLAQTTWDPGLGFTISGTLLGSTGATVCTITSAGGSSTQSCNAWGDYNTSVVFPSNPTGQTVNSRWQISGAASFTQTIGGNTNNVNYYKQYQISVTGGNGISLGLTRLGTTSTISSTLDWADSGTSATATSNGIFNRASGTGQRILSYNIDGGTSTIVATTGNVAFPIIMGSTHTINFASVTQYQLTLDGGASSSLASVTSPSIPGDNYWYDSGTTVSLSLYGIQGRSAGAGSRIASFTINGGTSNPVSTVGTVTALSNAPIASPLSITSISHIQLQLTDNNLANSEISITGSTISGDPGWYDYGTSVSVTLSNVWNVNSGISRTSLVSYSVDGSETAIPRGGNGTFTAALSMNSSHTLADQAQMQYYIGFDSGGTSASLRGSQTSDGWFDAGTKFTVHALYSNSYVADQHVNVYVQAAGFHLIANTTVSLLTFSGSQLALSFVSSHVNMTIYVPSSLNYVVSLVTDDGNLIPFNYDQSAGLLRFQGSSMLVVKFQQPDFALIIDLFILVALVGTYQVAKRKMKNKLGDDEAPEVEIRRSPKGTLKFHSIVRSRRM